MVGEHETRRGVAAVAAPLQPHDVDAFPDDVQLMRAVADGNARARRILARRLVNRTRKTAQALLGAGADADDAAQQSLLAILAGASGYRGDASVETWSQRITVRTCLRAARVRRRRSRRTAVEGPAELPTVERAAPPWHEGLARPLEHYLDRLPDLQREALVLRYTLDLSLPEIAERTGASIPAVRYRLWTGLKRLRRWIERDAETASKEGRS